MKSDKTGRKAPLNTTRVATPNDLKLSDCGARRGSCEGGTKKEATDVGQRPARTRRVQARIAATVTRGAVRCSALLGVAVVREKLPATTGQNRKSALSMEGREGQNRGSLEKGDAEDGEKLGRAETLGRCERKTDWLGAGMKRRAAKPCGSGEANSSGQTLNEA